jgi:recombination protein U
MNYPGGIKIKNISKEINYKNRGMTLENDINKTNEYYKEIEKAYIYKKPTPIKIVKVDYPSREKAIIKEAYFTIPSTTDYNGLYKGKYIDFEAKETISKTSFSLSNIHKHQIKHLDNIDKNGGISFIIVRFTTLNKTYFVLAKDFIEYVNNATRKSIPIDFFEKKAYILNDTYRPPIDYLKVVDYIIGGNNGKEN